jgi:amino acid transporter
LLAGGSASLNETVIAVTSTIVFIVIVIVVVVVWFIAKNRFARQDMTVISPNPGYMPSDDRRLHFALISLIFGSFLCFQFGVEEKVKGALLNYYLQKKKTTEASFIFFLWISI